MHRLAFIVDPLNHIFQLALVTDKYMVPVAEFTEEEFLEFGELHEQAWTLYQSMSLQPSVVDFIQGIKAIDKVR